MKKGEPFWLSFATYTNNTEGFLVFVFQLRYAIKSMNHPKKAHLQDKLMFQILMELKLDG